MKRPEQAVILAGGQGTRLAPLTALRPKPMVCFHGKPFLAYLIERLRDQGFRRIVILVGYLAERITEYFGDGADYGVEILYSESPVGDDTGLRLKKAASLIEDRFFLLYCDNYYPFDFEAMWIRYLEIGAANMVTVYANLDQYTRDNLIVADGLVKTYDKSRQLPDLGGVDIGFMILRRDALDLLPSGNVSFEKEVFPKLIAGNGLSAYVTRHRYYSVGDMRRLPATDAFLRFRPTILLDRDGVLNEKMPRADYVKSWSEWRWRRGALDGLRLLAERGYEVIVITNQAGIARGALTETDLNEIHYRMGRDAEDHGGHISAIYHCPHGWDEGCDCRKPSPGMIFQAQADFNLDLSGTFFLGDDERDRQAAEAAACRFLLIDDTNDLYQIVKERVLCEGASASLITKSDHS